MGTKAEIFLKKFTSIAHKDMKLEGIVTTYIEVKSLRTAPISSEHIWLNLIILAIFDLTEK